MNFVHLLRDCCIIFQIRGLGQIGKKGWVINVVIKLVI